MELQEMTSPWQFAVWKIDIIREVRPKASNGHHYIIVAIDYFSKWVEAVSYIPTQYQMNSPTIFIEWD